MSELTNGFWGRKPLGHHPNVGTWYDWDVEALLAHSVSTEGQLAEATNARASLHKVVERLQNERQEAEYLIKWALNWTGKKAFSKDGNLAYWRERAIAWTEGK